MANLPRVVVTGTGAVCGAGRTPDEILDAVQAGRSAVAPIRQWDTAGWPVRMAAEIPDYNPTALVEDRKLHKLIRRTDLLGLYAAGRAIQGSGLAAYRDGLAPEAAAAVSDRIGVYVGSGGGAYQNQYEFFPLLTAAGGDLRAFGAELGANVNPMWLLRTLPNNVLCHVGIRYGLKGANACVTNHVVGGTLAVIEAAAALRTGEADRAVAIGHDAPIEPQMVLYYYRVGLFATEAVRPFDAARDGSLFGEGAGALVLETADAAASRGAAILGEILGSGSTAEGDGLFTLRDDGDGLARAIEAALADAGIRAAEVGMISAHGNGTRQSDASEAAAIRRIFGPAPPPVTAFKWAFGHLIAASGPVEAVLTLLALRRRTVPGVATLRRLDPACAELPVSARPQTPRSEVGLVLSRGFGGTNAALVVRAAAGGG
jgi:3-oxoacyl-[acyl-carrier-protein] synthase-1